MASSTSRVLVVGSGAVGLRTALELLRSKINVILRSPCHSLHESTCSMGAGGLWMPVYCNDPRASQWAKETLDELLPMAHDATNSLVEIVPAMILQNNKVPPEDLADWTNDPRIQFQQVTTKTLWDKNLERYQLKIPPLEELLQAGYHHAHVFYPPVVDAPKMLQHMLDEITNHPLADVNVETGKRYQSIDELHQVGEDYDCSAIINCTGLGANQLLETTSGTSGCDEDNEEEAKEMVGARGILLHYDRCTCVRRTELTGLEHDTILMTEDPPWAKTTQEPCYLIPRGNVLVVGGSYIPEDEQVAIRPYERDRLVQNAHRLGIDTDSVPFVNEWTGFRPYRSAGIRCEYHHGNATTSIPVIHNYGHGGSGWTLNVGTAKHVHHQLLLPILRQQK